jgi:4-hydroxyphenylpyruvate dioxygenase-like putative hemolysin
MNSQTTRAQTLLISRSLKSPNAKSRFKVNQKTNDSTIKELNLVENLVTEI